MKFDKKLTLKINCISKHGRGRPHYSACYSCFGKQKFENAAIYKQ